MNQIDFVGGLAAPQQKKVPEVRNTRPSTAEEKAALALRLNELCRRCPRSVAQGSIQTVREWTAEQQKALKALKSKTASVHQLQSAVSAMERFA
jgi:hypothetical protein